MPVLVGDTFVARMDSKADRKQKTLLIHNIHFEPVKLTPAQITSIAEAIKAFAAFNQCPDIVIKKSNNRPYLKALVQHTKTGRVK